MHQDTGKHPQWGDLLAGQVVNNVLSKAGYVGLILSRETKISHATWQLSLGTTSTERTHLNYRAPVLWSPHITTREKPSHCNERSLVLQLRSDTIKKNFKLEIRKKKKSPQCILSVRSKLQKRKMLGLYMSVFQVHVYMIAYTQVCLYVCVCVYKGNKYLLVYAREKVRKCTRMFTVASFFCGVETEG